MAQKITSSTTYGQNTAPAPAASSGSAAGLKGAIRESEWLLRWAKKEAAKLERSVGEGTAEDPEIACLKLKRARVQLELRRGECEGLEKELVALREYLGETVKQQQKKTLSREPSGVTTA